MLPITVRTSPVAFSCWLYLLHVMLVVPGFFAWMFPRQSKVDGCLVYPCLGLAVVGFHLFGVPSADYGAPTSDCQISITTDMVCCGALTLFAIYVRTNSLLWVSVAAVLTPLLSTGGILAGYITLTHMVDHGGYVDLITWIQCSVAQAKRAKSGQGPSSPSATWTNLGYWEQSSGGNYGGSKSDYDVACERLALRMGEKVLAKGDAVLACGCGYGAELLFFKQKFGLKHITGLDPNPHAARVFPRENCARLLPLSVCGMEKNLPPRMFNRIVALDNIYHYPCKPGFFRACKALLPAGGTANGADDATGEEAGRIAVTDILLKQPLEMLPGWLRLALTAMNVSVSNLWTEKEYHNQLADAGFQNIVIELITPHVLPEWLPSMLLKHLDYAIITATAAAKGNRAGARQNENGVNGHANGPVAHHQNGIAHQNGNGVTAGKRAEADVEAAADALPKPKIAIIGSGMSGLACAHLLSAASYDVTVFEAKDKPGLTGAAVDLHGTLVDLPLRMIGENYYCRVANLAARTHTPLEVAQVNCCFYGDNGPRGMRSYRYNKSRLANVWESISTATHAIQAQRFASLLAAAAVVSETETFAEWLVRNKVPEQDNLPFWLFMGQTSWVLSCTMSQIKTYPAKIVLEFCSTLRLSLLATFLPRGWSPDICRVEPNVRALQAALCYGTDVRCNTPVLQIDLSANELMVNGERFDKVVVATEASAVHKVLKNADPVFQKVAYHPSSICLHTDESLMPPNKADWRALNVCQDKEQEMCMLTCWLNVYYPEANFPHNIFQTWNCFKKPQGDKLLKEVYFTRVVHTAATPGIVERIKSLQGNNNVFYAGSYCVYGMGLLEQAVESAETVVDAILREQSGRGGGGGKR